MTQASDPPRENPPIVDPSPTAPPITVNQTSLEEELDAHPAEASPDWVLALEPNRLEDAISGPDPQINPITYTHFTKPDGSDIIVPRSNVEYYERKGFTRGDDEDIPDLVAYQAERAKAQPEGGTSA